MARASQVKVNVRAKHLGGAELVEQHVGGFEVEVQHGRVEAVEVVDPEGHLRKSSPLLTEATQELTYRGHTDLVTIWPH